MIDNTKSFEERTTLTQRRVGPPVPTPAPTSRVNNLDKNRLKPVLEEEQASGAGAKIVIWVVIIIVLAVVAFLGLRSLLGGGSNVTPTVTPTPTPESTLEDQYVSSTVQEESEAEALQALTAYSLKDQTLGQKTESLYSFDNMYIQKFTTFTRIFFVLSRTESNDELPLVTASMGTTNTISVVFEPVREDTSGVPTNEEIKVNTLGMDFIMHDQSAADGSVKYLVKLNEALPYVLHSTSQENIVQVFIDVQEPAGEVTPTDTIVEPTVTTEVTGTTAPTPTVSPTTASGNVMTTSYSKSSQELLTGNTNKNITNIGYKINITNGVIKLVIDLKSDVSKGYPSLHGSYDGNKLTFELANRPDGTIAPAPLGYDGSFNYVTKIDVSRSSNSSKYEFYLTKQLDYKMTLNKDTNQVIYEIKTN